MKRFAILILISAIMTARAIDVKQISKVLDIPINDIDQCLTENHLKSEEIEKAENIFQEAFTAEQIEEYMKNFSCFISCAFEKSNIMKDGKVQMDEVLKVAKRNDYVLSPRAMKRLENCADSAKGDTDKCNTAFTFSMCFLQVMRRN